MKENSLYLQILIMAHCVGHSDFFKNNRNFSFTRADTVVPRMRNAKKRIQKYIEDPSIGIKKVEDTIDACHAISYQVPRLPSDIIDLKEERKKWLDSLANLPHEEREKIDQDIIPHKPELDILGFISEYGENMTPYSS